LFLKGVFYDDTSIASDSYFFFIFNNFSTTDKEMI